MSNLGRALDRLSARRERWGGSEGPPRAEVQEATQRLNNDTRRHMNAALFPVWPATTNTGQRWKKPKPASTRLSCIVRRWSPRSGAGLEHPHPDLLARWDHRIEQQIALGEPWPTD